MRSLALAAVLAALTPALARGQDSTVTLPAALSTAPQAAAYGAFPRRYVPCDLDSDIAYGIRGFEFEDAFLARPAAPLVGPEGADFIASSFGPHSPRVVLGLSEVAPADVVVEYRIDQQAGGQTRTLLRGREPVRAGTLAVFGSFESRSALVGYDIEIAAAAAIAQPIVRSVASGTGLALWLEIAPDGAFQAELLVRRIAEEPDQAFELGTAAMRTGRRNPANFAEGGLALRLLPGTPAVATIPEADGGRLIVTLAIAGAPLAQDLDPAFAYVPTLVHPAIGFRAPPLALAFQDVLDRFVLGMDEPDPVWPSWGKDALGQVVLRDAARLLREGGDPVEEGNLESAILAQESGLFLIETENPRSVQSALRDLALARLRSASVELTVAVLREGGSGEPLARFESPVLVDVPVAFVAGRVREVIAHWDVDVANVSRIPNPLFVAVEDGVKGTLRVVADASGRPAAVECDLAVAKLRGIDAQMLSIAPAVPAGEAMTGASVDTANGRAVAGADGSLVARAPGEPALAVVIEHPRLAHIEFRGSYSLRPEGDALIARMQRSGDALLGPGAAIEVTVRVKG